MLKLAHRERRDVVRRLCPRPGNEAGNRDHQERNKPNSEVHPTPPCGFATHSVGSRRTGFLTRPFLPRFIQFGVVRTGWEARPTNALQSPERGLPTSREGIMIRLIAKKRWLLTLFVALMLVSPAAAQRFPGPDWNERKRYVQ